MIDWSKIVTPEGRQAEGLATARAAARERLIQEIETRTAAISGPVPLAEKLCWSTKENAARALLAGVAAPEDQALIAAEAGMMNEEPLTLADRIVVQAEAWRAEIARLTGLRRRTAAAITAAESTEAVETALAEAMILLEATEA